KNSDYRIIVSSRKIRELDDIPCFEYYSKLELLPFNNEQIRSLIYRYISDDEERQNFYSLIKFNSDLNLLLSNPLLLSLSIGIYLIKKVLPSSLPTLVEEIITHLLERWDSSRQINRYKFLNHHEAKNILENISFNLFKDKKQVFDENYAISCLPYKYKKSKINELLKEIEESTSLIFNQKEKWSFSHVLYKEFFCANYLIENSRGIESEYTKYNKMIEWRNVWNTAIYKSNDPEFYIRELKRYNQNEYLLELNRILNILFKAQYKGKDVEKRLINLLKETTTKLKSSLQIEFKSKELILLRTSKASKINSSLLNDLINTFSVIGINEEEYPKDIFRFKAENDIDNLIKILVVNKCYVSVRDQDSYVSIKLINTGANK
ncbi:hypothetical protein, partial [Candidatus Oleimmundimicrobium sp.]|uniref:NACHT domain-containing protein n=1 Tax=Candidatus Oleimmundimicrobium sp. TaxID=3060597 RepID=UPI002716985F